MQEDTSNVRVLPLVKNLGTPKSVSSHNGATVRDVNLADATTKRINSSSYKEARKRIIQDANRIDW